MASRFGRVVAAVRENEQRALLLGYNASLIKLAAFTLGGALAGLAGMLYANWGAFVSPGVFGLSQSAQIIIWVLVGGRGTLIGPIVACVALQAMVTQLGAQQAMDTGLVLGAILILFVLLIPRGLAPTVMDALRRPVHAAARDARSRYERYPVADPGPGRELWRRARGARRGFPPGTRRNPLPDRPQRRRQEHFLQNVVRPASAQPGRHPFQGRPLRGLPTHEVARLGIGIKTQVPSVFEGLDVRENLLLAAARRRGRTARLPSPTRSWPRPAWATWLLRPSTRWRTASASGWSWA